MNADCDHRIQNVQSDDPFSRCRIEIDDIVGATLRNRLQEILNQPTVRIYDRHAVAAEDVSNDRVLPTPDFPKIAQCLRRSTPKSDAVLPSFSFAPRKTSMSALNCIPERSLRPVDYVGR